MDKEISLKRIFTILIQKWWLIVACVLLCGAISYVFSSFFIQPLYSAKTTLYVNNNNNRGTSNTDLNINDLTVSQKLVDTYIVVLKSDRVLNLVAEQSNLGYSASKIRSMLEMSAVSQTEILQIVVKGTNANHCAVIANTLAEVAPEEIIRVVKAGSVEVVDRATANQAPVSPNKTTNTLMGMIFGMALAVAILFLMELFDTRIKDEDTLVGRYEIPILGSIPALLESSAKDGEEYKA